MSERCLSHRFCPQFIAPLEVEICFAWRGPAFSHMSLLPVQLLVPLPDSGQRSAERQAPAVECVQAYAARESCGRAAKRARSFRSWHVEA